MFDLDAPLTDEQITAYVDDVMSRGPRRFVLFGLMPDRFDMGVVGWGIDFGDEAIFITDGKDVVFSASGESVRDRFALCGEVRLEWLDPPSPADCCPAPDCCCLDEDGAVTSDPTR